MPPAQRQATAIGGGAYVNATSERALGTELESKIDLGHGLLFQGEYTYLDAVVTKAFGVACYQSAIPEHSHRCFLSAAKERGHFIERPTREVSF